MTSTDRAFISAFQRKSEALAPAADQTTASAAPRPHFAPRRSNTDSARAPLSQVLREVREAQVAEGVAPFYPAIEIEAFAWPTLATQLAAGSEATLLALIDRFTRGSSG